jgi:hypothetical protein
MIRYLLTSVLFFASSAAFSLEHFITRDAHRLMNGNQEFRFAGIHAPELHRIENDARSPCKADTRDWGQYFQWPTADEQENWIKALTRSGHKAMRVYVLSVEHESDAACQRETHILKPEKPGGMPQLNEKAMRVYDRMIALSHEHDLRLILPFVDHWKWWGGRVQLAQFYGEGEDALYDVNSQTYQAYQHIIRQVILRKNTITGRLYRDEKAIMAWETGNELLGTNEHFLKQTVDLIASLDSNHLIIDGTYTRINQYALDHPDVDIISNHYYTNVGNNNPQQVLKDLKEIAGKKVYFVGEFGLLSAKELNDIMQAVVHTEYQGARAAGGLVWGFRGHRHNGGFYWHPEWTGHYSYHLPGFPEGDHNEEQAVVDLVRLAQAQMNGLSSAPALPRPEAPKMRKIIDPISVNWMGAPLGRFYQVERSRNQGPWQIIADKVSDGMNRFDPAVHSVFSDEDDLPAGHYCYRVKAMNEGGMSPASNVECVNVP